jgi:FdhD protein
MQSKILKKVEYIKANGEFATAKERIIKETALKVVIDGQHFTTAMIMASMEKEYVVGYLFIQGIISSTTDIVSIEIEKNIANIQLKHNKSNRTILQCINSDLTVHKEDVFRCVRAILKSPIFSETEAVHSAGLFLNGNEAVSITEDLGRHNALDKVIGAGLLKNIDFNRTLAASTGRQPTEMILKCRSAGIPIIATKGVPTTMAVELAEQIGITIAGLVRGETMVVYSHPERIRVK